MGCNSRAVRTLRVFLGGATANFVIRKVGTFGMFPVQQRRRNPNQISNIEVGISNGFHKLSLPGPESQAQIIRKLHA